MGRLHLQMIADQDFLPRFHKTKIYYDTGSK